MQMCFYFWHLSIILLFSVLTKYIVHSDINYSLICTLVGFILGNSWKWKKKKIEKKHPSVMLQVLMLHSLSTWGRSATCWQQVFANKEEPNKYRSKSFIRQAVKLGQYIRHFTGFNSHNAPAAATHLSVTNQPILVQHRVIQNTEANKMLKYILNMQQEGKVRVFFEFSPYLINRCFCY